MVAALTDTADTLDDTCQTTEVEAKRDTERFDTAPYMINPGSGRLAAFTTVTLSHRIITLIKNKSFIS
jgi:hypothetical protein